MTWTLRSPAFENGQPIPLRHTGDGEDLSPALAWLEPPAGTRELALVVDDPDAPSREPWVHWVLYKVPAATRDLPQGVLPVRTPPTPATALQGKNSWGGIGWRGPEPPRGHGVHHYCFRLLALDAVLPLDAGLEAKALLDSLSGHILAQAELMGTYKR
jgi:Raf kinase inhibitor-like YbhB/YbcL family protein